jgi:hypothetical protein
LDWSAKTKQYSKKLFSKCFPSKIKLVLILFNYKKALNVPRMLVGLVVYLLLLINVKFSLYCKFLNQLFISCKFSTIFTSIPSTLQWNVTSNEIHSIQNSRNQSPHSIPANACSDTSKFIWQTLAIDKKIYVVMWKWNN